MWVLLTRFLCSGDDLILQGSPSENDVRVAQPGKGIRPYADVELDYLMAVWVDV